MRYNLPEGDSEIERKYDDDDEVEDEEKGARRGGTVEGTRWNSIERNHDMAFTHLAGGTPGHIQAPFEGIEALQLYSLP